MSIQRRGGGNGNGRAAIADFISPDDGLRGKMQRKGGQVKNHMKDNLRQIRDVEYKNREAKELASIQDKEPFKLRQFRDVESRLHETTTAMEQATARSGEVDHSNFLTKGKAAQVRENLAEDNRVKRAQLEAEMQAVRAKAGERSERRPSVPRAEEVLPKAPCVPKNFISENKLKSQAMLPPKVMSKDSNDKHEAYGRLPDYLMERKMKAAIDEEERKKNAPDPDCPRGMKRMPEEERLSTLEVLTSSKEECMRQLSKLPFIIDTPMLKNKQENLEQKLREIDNALELFRKPKVFIAMDS
mmetsp:Transcript_37004/g.37657  ORF Transcript_37004/g.37657 Transcript_37004/m.37657 type:complete len:300 (+) Transcript_37004:183-1082(+)|eukprot:CAMPEP_0182418114 /NCGR_PEP_ID=MMETSP1167-20130531/2586_1 /TAXON_ID=2988 /ORGANISM="Mallomonas Sp, Strain CCMP3275" /LENGTH=299 /DNA_ID=CAMNT_0024592135 /DNA_START=151 /DNA_END=1050 /DNA_ORIENTATION=-